MGVWVGRQVGGCIKENRNHCMLVLRVVRCRVKIDEGLGVRPPGAVVNPLWKSVKMGLGPGGSVLDNLQLNNSLTHSNSRYFTISGKNIKIRPPWGSVEQGRHAMEAFEA